MRNMSFALTTAQVRCRQKTVTRRLGWRNAKPGDVAQPVVKAQGIPKGHKVEKINGPIRFVDVRIERLNAIEAFDVILEGFPGMTPEAFVAMFCEHNRCLPDDEVVRIQFEFVDA